jgi:hypothetical protein
MTHERLDIRFEDGREAPSLLARLSPARGDGASGGES